MFPENEASSSPVPAAFLGGRGRLITGVRDFEDGGIALRDSSRGLMYQVWSARREEGAIYLSAPNTPEFEILRGDLISEISFTFDQNMRLVLAYVDDGVAKMRWYNTASEQDELTILGADVITPRVALDDKRESQLSISDVVLMYVRGDAIYHRLQRDRYDTEYLTQEEGGAAGLVKIGMMRNMRFGWMVAGS